MRKVVLYELLSIDGVAEEPGNWLFEGDDDLMANLADVIGRQDDVLLGRGTYDYWSGYWPTADVQPFADFINATPKHVFTSSRPEAAWEGSTFIDGPAEEHVAELKRGEGRDIGIHGSITLAQSLLRAGLVDELRLIVAPTVAASGGRLFAAGGELQRFELLEARGTSAGLILLAYAKRA